MRFVTDGLGTPAPLAPTRRLVVSGLYRHVRNPMYIAVVAAIVGQALLLGRAGLFVYAAAVWFTVAAFVRWYEEPALHARFAASYDEYRVAVPAWWPRLHPWTPGAPLTVRLLRRAGIDAGLLALFRRDRRGCSGERVEAAARLRKGDDVADGVAVHESAVMRSHPNAMPP